MGVFSPNAVGDVVLFLDTIPLGRRLMSTPSFVALFQQRYWQFLDTLYAQSTVDPSQWFSSFVPFIGQWFTIDASSRLAHGAHFDFVEVAFTNAQWLQQRVATVKAQLNWLARR